MIRGRLTDERGFTIIEVMVAILLLVALIAAGTSMFVNGTDGSLATQRQAALIGVADQQMESIRQEVKTQGFDALAMSAAPAAGATSTLPWSSTTYLDPNVFVTGQSGCGAAGMGLSIESNWDDTNEGPAAGLTPWSGCTSTASTVAEPLEVLSGGFVNPRQTGIAAGADTVTVDAYVTDTYVGCYNTNNSVPCPTISGGAVSTSQCTFPTSTSTSTTCTDARRVVVAVIPNVSSTSGRNEIGQSSPVYLSTIFTNPTPSNAPDASAGLSLGAHIG